MTTVLLTQIANQQFAQITAALVPSAGEGRGFYFPEINSILRWKDVVPGINKVIIIGILAILAIMALIN